MRTRREFLATAASFAAAAPLLGAQTQTPRVLPTDGQREIRNPLNGPIGLQLYSLRVQLRADVPGTLAKVRGMGFREVEGAGLWGKTAPELKALMDSAGLKCQSQHMGLDRLRDDLQGALAEARTLGATRVVCPWIAEKVTREDIMKTADVFNKAGQGAKAAGMRFGYHIHGYEFVPSSDGTLMDTLAKNTDAALVEFQVDVFHTQHGGGDPAKLIAQYGKRVTSLHLKDLKKGSPIKAGQPTGTPDLDVPLGTGAVDFPAILRAARAAGPQLYYIEDESADPLASIPKSLAYLEAIKL
jgi:sugar phosphate isomerase/epimerase